MLDLLHSGGDRVDLGQVQLQQETVVRRHPPVHGGDDVRAAGLQASCGAIGQPLGIGLPGDERRQDCPAIPGSGLAVICFAAGFSRGRRCAGYVTRRTSWSVGAGGGRADHLDGKTVVRLRLMHWTGMRPSQMARLQPGDFRLDEPTPFVVVPRGKGGRLAAIPLVGEGLDAAREFMALRAYGRWSCPSANKALERAAGKAGRRSSGCVAASGGWPSTSRARSSQSRWPASWSLSVAHSYAGPAATGREARPRSTTLLRNAGCSSSRCMEGKRSISVSRTTRPSKRASWVFR